MRIAGSLLMGMMIALCIGATASAADEGKPILGANAVDRLEYSGSKTEDGKLEHIAVSGQPFTRAIRMTTNVDPGVEWGLQATMRTDVDVKKGDVLLARFWLRCVDSMTGEGVTSFVFEQYRPPNDKAAEMRVGAVGQWLQCFVPFRADRDYPAGETQICFRGGYERQTIEIGGLELVNYGAHADLDALPRTHVSYAGREADAPWRKAALARIEQIRKAPLAIKVVDAASLPVGGASVHVAQRTHAFAFGSCVTVEQITGTTPDDARARALIEKYFNRVVFENDMKWPAMWDGTPPALDNAVAWLRERHIEIRGHNLQWPSWQWSPKQLRAFENDPAELRRRCAERVASAVGHFKGKLVEWDVVNEPYNNVDLQNILGRDVLVDWFRRAKAADPSCRMFLNDFGILDGGPNNAHRKGFYDTIQFLKAGRAPIDGIGIQSHFGSVMPPPAQIVAVLDQFAELGLPIESTEVSINNDDRTLQADYLRDYMIALFSHPKVEGIMLWGFWEGSHWRPSAALWKQDWTPRPIGQAWLDLVTKQWMTDASIQTDANGLASVRGFLGDYAIDVTAGGKTTSATASLGKDGATVMLQLK